MKKIFAISLTSLVASLAMVIAPATSYAAGSASLTFSPHGGSHTVGSVFAITVSENSGSEAANVVQASMKYDTSRLRLAGGSCNTSNFEITAPGSSGITCGTSAPKTGSRVVGTISFKVIAAGQAAISFGSGSAIYSSTTNSNIWNGAANGGTFSMAAAAPVHYAPATPVAVAPTATHTHASVTSSTTKKAVVKKPATTTVTQPSSSGVSAWIYVPLALLIAAGGMAYIFRKDLAKGYKGAKKSFRNTSKNLRKSSLLKSIQRS